MKSFHDLQSDAPVPSWRTELSVWRIYNNDRRDSRIRKESLTYIEKLLSG